MKLREVLRLTDGNLLSDLSLWLILLLPLILYTDVYQPFVFGRFLLFMFILPFLLEGVVLISPLLAQGA